MIDAISIEPQIERQDALDSRPIPMESKIKYNITIWKIDRVTYTIGDFDGSFRSIIIRPVVVGFCGRRVFGRRFQSCGFPSQRTQLWLLNIFARLVIPETKPWNRDPYKSLSFDRFGFFFYVRVSRFRNGENERFASRGDERNNRAERGKLNGPGSCTAKDPGAWRGSTSRNISK